MGAIRRISSNFYREDLGLQTSSMALRTWHLTHVRREPLLLRIRLRLIYPPVKKWHDTFKRRTIFPYSPICIAITNGNLVIRPMHDRPFLRRSQVLPRRTWRNPQLLGYRLHHFRIKRRMVTHPRCDGFDQWLCIIRNY